MQAVPKPALRRWVGWLTLVAACAALGAGSVVAWRWHRLPDRVQAGLPAPPSLTGQPAALVELLAAAQRKAMVRGTALDGVAELGRVYHANDYPHEAATCWRLLRAEQPANARWCYYLADLARSAGDYVIFEERLRETVELDPDYSPAWLQLAELKFKTGRMDAAESDYRRRLALVPGDPYATLGVARVAWQADRRDEARRLIEQVVRDTPDFPPARNLLAEMLALEGDTAGAAEQRRRARLAGRFREADDPWLNELNDWCRDPKRLYLLSAIQFQTHRGDRGQGLLERAIQLAPHDPAGYELLGSTQLKLGEPAKARETLALGLEQAQGTKPSPMHFVYLAQACRELRQPEEALRVVERGLAEADDAFELHDARGVALGELGRYAEAVEAFRAAIARHPNDATANSNLAMALLSLGQIDEARDWLGRALALQPTHPQALSVLGRMELDAGRLEAAGEYLRPLYETYPEMPEARHLIAAWSRRAGMAAAAANDPAAAERLYREGLSAMPDDAELNASLGVLCLVAGRFDEARAPLEAYHRLRPAEAQSSLFLGQVYARLGRLAEARRILTEGAEIAERSGNSATARFCREILRQL